jgi:glycolate oxidase iron-sulfur subunit
MQTSFTPAQLEDPAMRESEKILRTCVHCGFCTATCPTYLILGDELDSPRGRIYLIKDMLEGNKPASAEVTKHIDRCLSCLSCMTTCPSGVHYMHLVDHARAHIEKTYRRPVGDRALRALLATVLPNRRLFALATVGGKLARFVVPALKRMKITAAQRAAAMLALVPKTAATKPEFPAPRVVPAAGARRARVVVMQGCAQTVLAPEINDAAVRLLTRLGVEVVLAKDEGCCGALVHHMGKDEQSHAQAKRNIDVWTREIEGAGLDAILITASGCGTTVKDYGHMLREDASHADKAARVSALTKDVSEFLAGMLPAAAAPSKLVVAYHSACSMQHGQGIKTTAQGLLRKAGFQVKEVPEGHICCGSAGVYNILQPELSGALRARKVENIAKTAPQLVATGNIGCIGQIALGFAEKGMPLPIVHTVELLDWATGGPVPVKLRGTDLEGAMAGAAPGQVSALAPAAE